MHRAALLIVALALAGCGGDGDPGDPGEFVRTLIQDLGRGETGKAWQALHPLHRERVSRALYVRCEGDDAFGGTVTKVDVLEVKEEPASIPGQPGDRPSTAVTVGITLVTAEADERFTLTAHVFESEGAWTWVIGPVDYAAYRTGTCPT